MVRNSIDHGLETKQERLAQGKTAEGHVTLKSYRKSGFFYLELIDDGRGLNKDKILEKAISKELISQDQELPDSEIFQLIFHNGFSTRDQATDISGRGVGMDVVKQAINRLKGDIHIESTTGAGTKFTIKLPLTLAIFNGMIIKVLNECFIVPNSDVKEVVKIKDKEIRRVDSNECLIQIRDMTVPLIYLRKALAKKQKQKVSENQEQELVVLISEISGTPFAFAADDILSQSKIVHKNLGREIRGIKGISGGTILGDGRVALIIDLPSFVAKRSRS